MSLPRTFLFSAFIVSLLLTPAYAQGRQGAGLDEEVRGALQQLKFAYSSRDVMRMMSCLDDKYPGWLEFKSSVQDYFLAHKDLEILFYQNTVLGDGNMVNARIRWYKRAFTQTGTFQKTEGECQLGFTRKSRGLKLYYVRGANPFF